MRQVLVRVRQSESGRRLAAVGHRIVHGADFYESPVLVDDKVMTALRGLEPLAPLHQPASLRLIEHCREELPGIANVACFDTAFHQNIPAVARNYALPRDMTEAGMRAYGFHGISYAYVWSELQRQGCGANEKRIVIAHLGAGASLCAMSMGRCVATTMGFSTAEGLPMATRTGSLDPGLLIHMMRTRGMTADDIEHLIYRAGGLKGVSGISGDMRELRSSAEKSAREAIDLFVYRIVCAIGGLAASMQGIDTLVFTGGVGANDELTRGVVVAQLEWLNEDLEVMVIPTDEEKMIAEYTASALRVDS